MHSACCSSRLFCVVLGVHTCCYVSTANLVTAELGMREADVLQAIIIHKWHSHARRHLLFDMGLYLMLMVLFIADLCLVGLSMGRSPLEENWVSVESPAGHRFTDARATGLASALLEVVMLLICIRDLWYDRLVLFHCDGLPNDPGMNRSDSCETRRRSKVH